MPVATHRYYLKVAKALFRWMVGKGAACLPNKNTGGYQKRSVPDR